MRNLFKTLLVISALFLFAELNFCCAQVVEDDQEQLFSLIPAETPVKKRVLLLGIGSSALYSASLIGLNETWYSNYPRGDFHFFNDLDEWMLMDKFGHAHAAYFESEWLHAMLTWSGINNRRATNLSMAGASVLQLGIEVLDGFSDQWGFSWYDVAANTSGTLLFGIQQHTWGEQRIRLKFSSFPSTYPSETIVSNQGGVSTLSARTDELFGHSIPERILKDYNAQTYWLSVNPASFAKDSWGFLDYVNIAFGTGAYNMYGGDDNTWCSDDGPGKFILDDSHPRAREFYLSLDLDLRRIKSKKPWVRTLLGVANCIKVPFPALKYSKSDGFQALPLYF